MSAAFEFIGYNINKLIYENISSQTDQDKDTETITNEIRLDRNNEDPSTFRLSLNVNVKGKKNICLEMYGFFKWRIDYIENDTERSLISFGTTILYPYARAAISSISILDGGDPIILPTINPFNMDDNQKSEPSIIEDSPK